MDVARTLVPGCQAAALLRQPQQAVQQLQRHLSSCHSPDTLGRVMHTLDVSIPLMLTSAQKRTTAAQHGCRQSSGAKL